MMVPDDAIVLVTGGTGFIGSFVVRDLTDHGHDVVAYDLSSDRSTLQKLGVDENITIRQGDITDPTDVVRAIKESEATHVIHLAALLTTTARENPRAALQVNVQGTNNIFEGTRTLKDQVQRVVWASSAAVYAPPWNYDTEWVTEEDLVYPDTLYGATKEYNEHQARVYHEDFGLDHVGLRPTVAYGPYRETGGSAFLADIVEKPALGEPFAVKYGDQAIDWQHVEDVAQAFRKAAFAPTENLGQRIYNVRGELATVREAVEIMRQIVPDADLEVSDDGELPWTQRLDMTAAQTDLGYTPEYDLETGFRDYANTVREEAGLNRL